LYQLIKINATQSTNDYLREISKERELPDGLTLRTFQQTQGKGQQGSKWVFTMGKSLAFSVFRRFEKVSWDHQYYVNFMVCLAIKEALDKLNIPRVQIKWPNDILADGKKVCGVLVENQLQQNGNYTSIIGVGINVNNTHFEELPKASSLKLSTGIHYELDEVFYLVRNAMEKTNAQLRTKKFRSLKERYENALFKKDEITFFKRADGSKFKGTIKGVSDHGKLLILLDDQTQESFQLKEIELIY